MPENTAETSQKPLLTVRFCDWCNDKLPITARSHAKYCCSRCRYYGAVDRGRTGKVASVRKLKNGKISVVVYMTETNLRPGQPVKVGVDF